MRRPPAKRGFEILGRGSSDPLAPNSAYSPLFSASKKVGPGRLRQPRPELSIEVAGPELAGSLTDLGLIDEYRTTKLYDRTGEEITLDEVERIAI